MHIGDAIVVRLYVAAGRSKVVDGEVVKRVPRGRGQLCASLS